jgi:hypothetical protein
MHDFPPSKNDPKPPARPQHVLGVDLGQQSDPTALALVRWTHCPTLKNLYRVPTLKRFALGTPYLKIVESLVKFYGLPELRDSPPILVVDATGVGSPVCEMVRQAMGEAKARGGMVEVTITAGSAVTHTGSGRWNVAKKQLASTLQVLLGQRRLEIAGDQPEAATLARELGTFEVKITEAGHESFEAWRERDHDDLVLAVALACWAAEYLSPNQWGAGPPRPCRLRA